MNWGNRPDRLNLSPSLLHVYKPTGEGIGIGDPLPKSGAHVLEQGSWSAAIVEELACHPADIHVAKYRMSGFWDTPLDSILRNLGVTTLLFAGVNLDQCVLCTLQDANFLGYDCILLEDCCATTSPDYCVAATLYNVRQCFGFVTTTPASASDRAARTPPRASRFRKVDAHATAFVTLVVGYLKHNRTRARRYGEPHLAGSLRLQPNGSHAVGDLPSRAVGIPELCKELWRQA